MVAKEKASKPERERLYNGEAGEGAGSESTQPREERFFLKHFPTMYWLAPTGDGGGEQRYRLSYRSNRWSKVAAQLPPIQPCLRRNFSITFVISYSSARARHCSYRGCWGIQALEFLLSSWGSSGICMGGMYFFKGINIVETKTKTCFLNHWDQSQEQLRNPAALQGSSEQLSTVCYSNPLDNTQTFQVTRLLIC